MLNILSTKWLLVNSVVCGVYQQLKKWVERGRTSSNNNVGQLQKKCYFSLDVLVMHFIFGKLCYLSKGKYSKQHWYSSCFLFNNSFNKTDTKYIIVDITRKLVFALMYFSLMLSKLTQILTDFLKPNIWTQWKVNKLKLHNQMKFNWWACHVNAMFIELNRDTCSKLKILDGNMVAG